MSSFRSLNDILELFRYEYPDDLTMKSMKTMIEESLIDYPCRVKCENVDEKINILIQFENPEDLVVLRLKGMF